MREYETVERPHQRSQWLFKDHDQLIEGLIALRRSPGLTQTEVADRMGVG